MAQPYLTNTQRGRGWKHRQAAAQLRRQFKDGDICRRCNQPMWSWQQLDAGHPPSTIPLHLNHTLPDALEHRACNRRAGQNLGAARRKAARRAHLPQW